MYIVLCLHFTLANNYAMFILINFMWEGLGNLQGNKRRTQFILMFCFYITSVFLFIFNAFSCTQYLLPQHPTLVTAELHMLLSRVKMAKCIQLIIIVNLPPARSRCIAIFWNFQQFLMHEKFTLPFRYLASFR